MSIPRSLAIILSIGGVGWGVFCLPFLFWNPQYSVMIFGPGYVATAGYLWRASVTPSYGVRNGIWFISGLVQGAWLIWALIGVAQGQWFRGNAFAAVTLGWWTFAFAASVLAAFTEWDEPDHTSGITG